MSQLVDAIARELQAFLDDRLGLRVPIRTARPARGGRYLLVERSGHADPWMGGGWTASVQLLKCARPDTHEVLEVQLRCDSTEGVATWNAVVSGALEREQAVFERIFDPSRYKGAPESVELVFNGRQLTLVRKR